MGIGTDIKQKNFKSEFSKAVINLMYTSNWLNEQENKLFKPHGLTTAQYNVLRILRGQYPSPATINLLIDRMLDRMSNASRIVDKLMAKNLVARQQNLKDRRAVDVVITKKGLDILERIDVDMEKFEQSINQFTEQECKDVNTFLDRFRGTVPY
ncbi:MAG: DNA-binding MarR family transcriptional regulator [Cyclobacteriaceae bacterium]|jgi:DNA-binding MarR family transcriptional regulator